MLQLQTPFSMILSGASGSGKTRWTYDMLKFDLELRKNSSEGLFEKPFDKIIYAYSTYQPIYDEMAELYPNGRFESSSAVPWTEIESLDGSLNVLLVIDDKMSDIGV